MPYMSLVNDPNQSSALGNLLDYLDVGLGTMARTAGNIWNYQKTNPQGVDYLDKRYGYYGLGKYFADVPTYDPSGPIPVRENAANIRMMNPGTSGQRTEGGTGYYGNGTAWYEKGKGQDVLPQQMRRYQMDQTPGFNEVLQNQFSQNPQWYSQYAVPGDSISRDPYLDQNPGNPWDLEKARSAIAAQGPAIMDPAVQAMSQAAQQRIQPQQFEDARLSNIILGLLDL